jgi:integrase/recombinase XerD
MRARLKKFPKTLPAECSKLDFDLAVEIFKTEYMRDEWSRRSLNFHLENLVYFKRFLAVQNINFTEATLKILEQYVWEMRNAGKKKNTVNGRIKTLRVFFRLLNAKEYLPHNPAVYLKTVRGPQPEIIPFNSDQVKALLAQPDRGSFAGLRDYLVMQLLLDTGIRLNELCNIRLSDVNLKSCGLFVRKGKGSKTRTVGFGAETRKTMVRYLSYTGISDGETHLVLGQDSLPLKPRSVQERIAIHARNVGIRGVRPSPHTFRHTFAKMFLMNDGDPYVLRDLLGHNSMSTVIIYLKLFREDLLKKYRGKSPVDRLWDIKDDRRSTFIHQ